jgi:hypothetical protein
MPEELNKDQQAGLDARNQALRAYAKENNLEAFLGEAILSDHGLSLGTAKAKLRGAASLAPKVKIEAKLSTEDGTLKPKR